MKLAVFKLQFFKKYFEVFDGVVVIISFVLDIIPTSNTAAAAELVILARLWRVARIINGKRSFISTLCYLWPKFYYRSVFKQLSMEWGFREVTAKKFTINIIYYTYC